MQDYLDALRSRVLGMGSPIIIESARFSLFVCEAKVHRYVANFFCQASGGVVSCLSLLALLACCDSAAGAAAGMRLLFVFASPSSSNCVILCVTASRRGVLLCGCT